MFDKLRDDVLPGLFQFCEKNVTEGALLCLGCAGGEEPFTWQFSCRNIQQGDAQRFGRSFTARTSTSATIRAAQQAEYMEDRSKRSCRSQGSLFPAERTRFRLVPELREMVTFCKAISQDN